MKKSEGILPPRSGKAAPSKVCPSGNRTPKKTSRIYATYLKRIFDICFAISAIPFVLPVLIVLYFIVKKDGGPFFFRHPRIGRDGHVFGCLKIRTMHMNAEAVLSELLETDTAMRQEWDRHFKLRNDPRVTPIGRILRKTSLDELPQIFNILLGHMSVVGPRPITEEELAQYDELASEYAKVRPGLTGPWQITGRRENDFEKRALMDAAYVADISFVTDLYILLATVPEVIFGRGR